MRAFIESGHLTRGYLRIANDISDVDFTNYVSAYYKNIDEMKQGTDKDDAITRIKKLNPGLTNSFVNGNLTDIGLGKPKDADEWQK